MGGKVMEERIKGGTGGLGWNRLGGVRRELEGREVERGRWEGWRGEKRTGKAEL